MFNSNAFFLFFLRIYILLYRDHLLKICFYLILNLRSRKSRICAGHCALFLLCFFVLIFCSEEISSPRIKICFLCNFRISGADFRKISNISGLCVQNFGNFRISGADFCKILNIMISENLRANIQKISENFGFLAQIFCKIFRNWIIRRWV